MGSSGFGHLHPFDLASCNPGDLFLKLLPLVAHNFPQQAFHIPGISNILGSPLQLRFKTSHIALWGAPHRESSPDTHCLVSATLSFEIWVEVSWILHAFKTSIVRTTLRSDTSLSSSQDFFYQGCIVLSMPGQLSLGNTSISGWRKQDALELSHQSSLSTEFTSLYWILEWSSGLASSWNALKLSFLLSQCKILDFFPFYFFFFFFFLEGAAWSEAVWNLLCS
jgi:hypothetical protein